MRQGVSFSLTSEDEVTALELVCELTFCDMARLTVSGTEATMHAIRVARGFTRRDKIVKFEGQYHGVHDYALISVTPNDVDDLGDRGNPVKLAWGRGIPEAIKDTVIPVPYNDLDTLRAVFEREGDHIAAVLIEPLLGNAQGILPRPGFLQGVRELTTEFGALLIFDEVKTGFRLARGGAAELFGITPDLACYAKAMGNGYPAAAFGGRRDVMSVLPKDVSPRRHLRRQPGGGGRGHRRPAPDPRHGRGRARWAAPACASRPGSPPSSSGTGCRTCSRACPRCSA